MLNLWGKSAVFTSRQKHLTKEQEVLRKIKNYKYHDYGEIRWIHGMDHRLDHLASPTFTASRKVENLSFKKLTHRGLHSH